jgi:hypothetical protein
MRQSLNTLNDQKLELEIELQKVSSKNQDLIHTAIKRENQLKEFQNLKSMRNVDSSHVENLKLELQLEKQRSIETEKQVARLEVRLRDQAEQDKISTQISDNAIEQLEKQVILEE